MNISSLIVLPAIGMQCLALPMQSDVLAQKQRLPAVFIYSQELLQTESIKIAALSLEPQLPVKEQLALVYLSCGNANLLSQNYSLAISDYQCAFDVLENAKNEGVEFLAAFGMAIACDHLQFTEMRESSLARIRALIATFSEEGEGDEFSEPVFSDGRILSYLNTLAKRSLLLHTQSELSAFLSEIFSSPLASYSLFQAEGESAAKPCKSFWRRLEKLGHNIYRVCDKVLTLMARALDIMDRSQGHVKEIYNETF